MANPQPGTVSVNDLLVSTIANRQKQAADANSRNNAFFAKIKQSKSVKPFTGGTDLRHEVNYAEAAGFKWYSGFEKLDTTHNEVLTYLVFPVKQAAVSVSVSGIEGELNSGDQKYLDILAERLSSAETTLQNRIAQGLYSLGTGSGGKELSGLQAYISTTPTSGTIGGITRSGNTFCQNVSYSAVTDGGAAKSSANIAKYVTTVYNRIIRAKPDDRPNLIISDNNDMELFEEYARARQYTMDDYLASLGFEGYKFKGATWMLDGGFGGYCPANTTYLVNTKHFFHRPHSKKNMVPLAKRAPVDQDAEIHYILFYGANTVDLPFLHGVLTA